MIPLSVGEMKIYFRGEAKPA